MSGYRLTVRAHTFVFVLKSWCFKFVLIMWLINAYFSHIRGPLGTAPSVCWDQSDELLRLQHPWWPSGVWGGLPKGLLAWTFTRFTHSINISMDICSRQIKRIKRTRDLFSSAFYSVFFSFSAGAGTLVTPSTRSSPHALTQMKY